MPVVSPALYVAIEGPIGVGKTTLTHELARRMNARVVLEVVEENPFLPMFYEDRSRYAFQTQMFFLMSRFRQQNELLQPDLFQPNIVADYHLLKDRIFAQLTLRDEELALYEQVHKALAGTIMQPDVMIYLRADQQVLLQRIDKRGRPFEADFDRDYLRNLADIYRTFFARYHETPLLVLDTSELDLLAKPEEIEKIVDEIHRLAAERPRAGRAAAPA